MVDWSVLNAQVEESLKDLDEDDDEEVTSDDEINLMVIHLQYQLLIC